MVYMPWKRKVNYKYKGVEIMGLTIRTLAVMSLFLVSGMASAISPYFYGDKVSGNSTQAVASVVEGKLKGAGFKVVGKYFPKNLPSYGVIVVTDDAVLSEIGQLGGNAILGAPIRVGVKADGTVSYMNPDYWFRAYFRKNFAKAEGTTKALSEKLSKALGSNDAFGGDESAAKLSNYRYMIGMERVDSSKNKLGEHASYAEAVKTVRENLAKNVGRTAKIYEISIPDKKISVFGVAMNDDTLGDGKWLKTIQMEESIAGLPYEIFVINGEVLSLHGRFRIALAFPDVGMGQFMRISSLPNHIMETMTGVAGGKTENDSENAWQ
jgi:hypothetical protein